LKFRCHLSTVDEQQDKNMQQNERIIDTKSSNGNEWNLNNYTNIATEAILLIPTDAQLSNPFV
jgi:hypothetical protein